MRIGIITFWESTDNYGQVLQAYALQQVLKNMGHEPFQIRYSLRASLSQEFHKTSLVKKILKVLLVYPALKNLRRKKIKKADEACRAMIEKKNIARQFPAFREKYLSSSKLVYNSIEEIRKNPPKADCYITGSDQVWTMLLGNAGNNAYFLDFGSSETKRIAYAASFSIPSYPEKLMPLLKGQLEKFDAISVREDEGIDICKQAGRNDIVKTLDPTLLLDKDAYLTLSNSVSTPRNYAFVYSINIRKADEIAWDEICKCADHRGVKLITTTSSGHFPGREIFPNTEYVYATIPEWIAYIHNSEFVATTSFHGVVFCLILNKPFVYFPLGGNGAKGNGRVHSLLSPLGLTNRIHGEKSVEEILQSDIDWSKVNRLLEVNGIDSLKFLNENLGQR